jgi:hypothetical protein
VLRLGDAADLISAPVLTGFKIGIDVSIAVGQLDSLLGVSNEEHRDRPAVVVEITSIPYPNARPHHVDLVHCSAADQEAIAATADHRCGSDHSRDVAVELA